MTRVTCGLAAKNRDQLRDPALGNRVRASFTFTCPPRCCAADVVNGDTRGEGKVGDVGQAEQEGGAEDHQQEEGAGRLPAEVPAARARRDEDDRASAHHQALRHPLHQRQGNNNFTDAPRSIDVKKRSNKK